MVVILLVLVVTLLVQDCTFGTPGLVESSWLLPGMLSSSIPLAFRFCHLINLALEICSISVASAYFLYPHASGLSLQISGGASNFFLRVLSGQEGSRGTVGFGTHWKPGRW